MEQSNDFELNNVFISAYTEELWDYTDEMKSEIAKAKECVCFSLQSGIGSRVQKMFSLTDVPIRCVVARLWECKYNKNVSVHVSEHIQGNYCIIDGKKLYLFDENLNGFKVYNRSVDIIQRIFQNEFEGNTNGRIAIHGNENVITDDTIGGESPLKNLLARCKTLAFTGTANGYVSGQNVIIKDAKMNRRMLENDTKTNIMLAPNLPICMAVDEQFQYFFNFDIGRYEELSKDGTCRLFALRVSDYDIGDVYKFERSISSSAISGKRVLDICGNPIVSVI